MGVAVLGGGFGGPEQRVDAALDGFLGRFGERNDIDGGVEGGFGVGVAEDATRSVRVFHPLLSTKDFEHDAPGGMQAPRWEPRRWSSCGPERLRFRS